MPKRRTIYFNDARHYYLFVFEPPMTLEDAQVPIDEAAGTSVDTFIYGLARGDGLFYPSKIGRLFGADMNPFGLSAYWRAYHNMKNLMDRGLDPLTVLIDRAHEKGMDFIASLRMTIHEMMDPAHRLGNGGGGLAHQEVRDHQFRILEELMTEYSIEGVELDLALPGGETRVLRPEDVEETTPVLTEYVKQIADMVRSRPGKRGEIGVRVLPTEEMNLAQGLDVRAWLQNGSVDFVVPILYPYFNLDPNMPIDWAIEAAHEVDAAVYAVLQPYVRDEATGSAERIYPTPEHARAAACNFYSKGADGLYAWFMRWPLGATERRILTELGHPDLMQDQDKHYHLCKRADFGDDVAYESPIPLEIASTDIGTRHPIPFYISDDIEGSGGRLQEVLLRIRIQDLVSADKLSISLNGQSLADEICQRGFGSQISPYDGQQLEFHLQDIRPRKGDNLLEIALDGRAENLASSLVVQDVQIIVRYSPYPASLKGLSS